MRPVPRCSILLGIVTGQVLTVSTRSGGNASGSSWRGEQRDLSRTTTIARMRRDGVLVRVKPDGTEEVMPVEPLAPLTEAEVEAAAWRDPDAPPFTPDELAKAKRIPRARTLRRSLRLTQEEFAARYHIPLGTLRNWGQGRSEPNQPARAYLTVIARDPEGVGRAREAKPG